MESRGFGATLERVSSYELERVGEFICLERVRSGETSVSEFYLGEYIKAQRSIDPGARIIEPVCVKHGCDLRYSALGCLGITPRPGAWLDVSK